jgi:hypothetical protein
MYQQPNVMAMCLRGLVRNSRLKPQILVIWSRPEEWGLPMANDYLIDHDTLKRYQKYKSVQQYIDERGAWCGENNIYFFDVTNGAKRFQEEYAKGGIYSGPFMGGTDIAWKDHCGISMTETPYVIPNWDADFYGGPGWDEILLKAMEDYRQVRGRIIAVPTQMQPLYFEKDPGWKDIWAESPKIACSRLTLPVSDKSRWSTEKGSQDFCAIYDNEFDEFCEEWGIDRVDEEQPGIRNRLHHFPVMYDTEEFKTVIGGYSYMGSRNCFLMHKGYVACKPEEV